MSDQRLPFAAGLVLLALVLGAMRAPLLAPGYGAEPDAWRVALTARTIASRGEYRWSRMPGHPLQELAYAMRPEASPAMLVGVTAALSVAAALLFAVILRRLGARHPLAVALGLGGMPVVLANSVTSMDYLWALAFLLAAFALALARRPVLAGVVLGCAVGCRITSGAMAFPLALLLLDRGVPQDRRRRPVAAFAASTAVVSAVWFAPVVATYGA